MNETYPQAIAEAQRLTQEYASFSQSRSGMGNVLGGIAGLVSFLAFWLLGRGVATAALTVGLTATWLVGKEVLRLRLYRLFGQARETWPDAQRRGHIVSVALVAIVCAAGVVVCLVRGLSGATPWSIALPYLVFSLITPWIAWRYLRTLNEFMVGFYLLFACAITSAGFVPDMVLFSAILPLYAVLLIATGLREHRQFQALAAQLRQPRGVEE